MNNSGIYEEMRGIKQILMNELGVIYKQLQTKDYDPDDIANFGTVGGGKFKFKAAHYEWLVDTGEAVGLKFNQMSISLDRNKVMLESEYKMFQRYDKNKSYTSIRII